MTTTWEHNMRSDSFAGHDAEQSVWAGFSNSTGLSATGARIRVEMVHRCLRDDCVRPGQPNVFLALSEPQGVWLTTEEARQLGEALLDAARLEDSAP